jgi:spore coat polysaccharide biosynthesis protein SpsF (cytidylyltransferase family)
MIGGKMLLQHVVDAAKSATTYLNKESEKYGTGIRCQTALLIPEGDSIIKHFASAVNIIEGPEFDVLARYKKAADILDADLIVRVTGDCPMIPPWMISKMVKVAHKKQYDYANNCEEPMRTITDGLDCEVMSKRMLDYAYREATDDLDREHVTTYIRSHFPKWATKGFIGFGWIDTSEIKLSVDTLEDLERVKRQVDRIESKQMVAESIYGKYNVHRF